jgi:hypothetical protein
VRFAARRLAILARVTGPSRALAPPSVRRKVRVLKQRTKMAILVRLEEADVRARRDALLHNGPEFTFTIRH